MVFLVIYSDKQSSCATECYTREEAVELVRNILEDGSVPIDAITVYEATRKEIILGIEK